MGVPLIPDRAAVSSLAEHVEHPVRRAIGGIELIGAFAVVTLVIAGVTGVVPAAAAITLGLLVPAAIVDAHEHRLPDIWLVAAVVGLLMAAAATVALGGSVEIGMAALGAAVMCAPIALLHLASPAAMGFGDVKLSIVLGAAIGLVDWRLTLVALSLAGLLGAVYGLATRQRTVAFGPFLVLAALATMLAADPILSRVLTAGLA